VVLQPMAPEAVLSDRDSEDDVDEELAVLEDRRVGYFLPFFLPLSNGSWKIYQKDVMLGDAMFNGILLHVQDWSQQLTVV
jgi:hypothetical protein